MFKRTQKTYVQKCITPCNHIRSNSMCANKLKKVEMDLRCISIRQNKKLKNYSYNGCTKYTLDGVNTEKLIYSINNQEECKIIDGLYECLN